MKKVAIFVVILGVVVFFKMRGRGQDSSEILSDMKLLVSTLDGYEANAAFLDQTLERCHRKAFDDSYEVGGRRRASTFDEDQYIQDILTRMVRMCNEEGKREVAAELAELRDGLLEME